MAAWRCSFEASRTGNSAGVAGSDIERLLASLRLGPEHVELDGECAIKNLSLAGVANARTNFLESGATFDPHPRQAVFRPASPIHIFLSPLSSVSLCSALLLPPPRLSLSPHRSSSPQPVPTCPQSPPSRLPDPRGLSTTPPPPPQPLGRIDRDHDRAPAAAAAALRACGILLLPCSSAAPLPDRAGPPNRASRSPTTTPSSPSSPSSSSPPKSAPSPPRDSAGTSSIPLAAGAGSGRIAASSSAGGMSREAQKLDCAAGGVGIGVLSLDLLGQVLDRLREPRDRKACRLVSHAFERAEAAHRRGLRVLRREPLPRLLRAFPALERLDLSACASLDDAFLAAAVAGAGGGLAGLRSVCLARANGVGWRGLEALVAACPKLEAVDLSHCVSAGDREVAAVAAAAGLRELRLDKCLAVTDMGLAKVAVGCPRLEKLSLKWCREISDIGIDLLAKKCPELRSLNISYLKVGNGSLRSISSLEKLEELAMVCCSCIDDEGLELLSKGSDSLQSVDMSRCDHVTSEGLASLIDGRNFLKKLYAADCLHETGQRFLSKLATLKETLTMLKLDGLEVSDSLLQAIGESCNKLVEIGLSKCSGVTDEGISSLVARCSDLRTIDLTCCNLITNNALDSIADNCKMLECLRLESCSLISEKGLKRIATCCPNLKEIDLTDCGVDDAALEHLARCSELRNLKLGLCASISDKGIAFISSSCGKLVELDLYRCNSITDDGLAALVNGCKRIKLLNLCYCNKITDTGLGHLGSLEELTNLELRCLVRITGIGISSVAIGCKSLIELDLKRCYSVDDAGLWALARYALNLRQLTISYCQVTGLGLCHLLSSLRCLQDIKMVHLSWVSIEGFEMALRAACGRLKKLKMLCGLKTVLSPELLQMLQACGCRIRWVNKPLVYKD